MDADSEPSLTPTPMEVSFVRGGPFYWAQRALGLIRPIQWNPARRIAFLIALGWLPPLLIAALLNLKVSSL